MLKVELENQKELVQNCKVKRTYKKCKIGRLCNPESDFDMIENCKTCNKKI